MSLINNTPSASLKGRFARAKKAAIDGKIGKVKVLAVSFVDVEMIERSETGNKPMGYSSFAHTFVIGISREGWRLYQAWGEHGYTLQEYLDRDRARLRDWDEAERFIKSFEALIEAETEVSLNRARFLVIVVTSRRILTRHDSVNGLRRSTTITKNASRSIC